MPAIRNMGQHLHSNRGSVLVGVVVASILIAISVSALMGVTGTTVNHEITALDNEKAFYAAESGLLLGTSWLAMQNNWSTINPSTPIISGLSINGATIVVRDSVGSDGKVFIISTATRAGLSYTKKLSWIVDSVSGGGARSIINNFKGVPKGLSGITLDGPAHFNEDIIMGNGTNETSQNRNKFMNGLVTVHSSLIDNGVNGSGLGAIRNGNQNDYTYGVQRIGQVLTAPDCDGIFKDRYLSRQDSLVLGYTVQNSISLPASTPGQIPTLVFNPAGGATYTYHDGTSWIPMPYTSSTANGAVFLAQPNTSINVYGTVNGQMSVATQGTTGDIHIVGEIKYANGFTPGVPSIRADGTYENAGNYGVTGTDVVALLSSRDIILDSKWTSSSGTQDFVTASSINSFIVGMIYAEGAITMNYQGTFGASNKAYFIGTRSANTFGDKFWDRGNDFNPFMLYDKRFGTGAVTPAGVNMTLHRYDSSNNNNERIGIEESRWTEKNIAL